MRSNRWSNECARTMRSACHHPGDRLTVIFIPRVPVLKEGVETLDTLRPDACGLQAQGDAIVGEGELGLRQPRRTAEITRRFDPHCIQCCQRTLRLRLSPRLVGK